jgi:6-pyruvoyltetrahydropterin/6-carboxytetrahydropterin synthase
MTATLKLSRELRFGLHDPPAETAATNGFAGNPALVSMDPFLTLTATVSGQVDAATGMLVNIKTVDYLLRHRAVPAIRSYYFHDPTPVRGGGDLLVALFAALQHAFTPNELDSLTLALSPYLKLSIQHKEPHVVLLSQRFEFSAAHRLYNAAFSDAQNWETFGRCNNPNGHGHNYELEVTVAGEPDPVTGIVFPVAELQKIVTRDVLDIFDHKHLNLDCPQFAKLNPTVENIAQVIFGQLRGAIGAGRLKRVRIWETPKTCCEYSDE